MQQNDKCDTMDRLKLQKGAIDKIKQLYSLRYDMGFVQEELPRVSKLTLGALVNKGILKSYRGVFGDDGPIYYKWTGKELE
jgi:hypothetical protein